MKYRPLPAIRIIDEIILLITKVSDEQIDEALEKLDVATSTWGLLWGLEDLRKSGADLDYYNLKRKVLKFVKELRKDPRFPLAYIVAQVMRNKDD